MPAEFAYSTAMQCILFVTTLCITFIIVYLITVIILDIFDEQAGKRQIGVFALLVGSVLNTGWVYGVYLIGGMNSFTPLMYALIVTPNPVFAMLYYFIGIKVLKASSARSFKMIGLVFLCYIIVQIFNRVLNTIFFVQTGSRYNYLIDVVCQLTLLCVTLAIFFLARYLIRRFNYNIHLDRYINRKRELAFFLVKTTLIYAVIILLPLFISNEIVVNLLIMVLFGMVFALSSIWEMYSSAKRELSYRDEYIRTLLHYHNVNSDSGASLLRDRMADNPSLISVLLGKYNYATQVGVNMNVELNARVDDLYIDNIDVCTMVDCLMDNAIEIAKRSERKTVVFMTEQRAGGEKVISVSCSNDTSEDGTPKVAPEQGYRAKNLSITRKIVSKHGNCAFQTVSHHFGVSAYVTMIRSNK